MKEKFTLIVIFFLVTGIAFAQVPTAADKIQNVGVFTQLGTKVDLGIQVTDSEGNLKSIKDFILPEKPFILMPVFYRCPGLCGITIQSSIAMINELTLKLGEDFSILTFSFNSKEGPELAKAKAASVYEKLNDPEAAKKGWHFAVATQENIDKLLSSLQYKLVPDGDDFAHPSAFFVLSSDGIISQYFTGVNFPAWDVKLSLVDASNGKIGNLLHQAALFCFRFDTLKGKYTLAAMKTMKIGGIITLIGVISFWICLVRRKKTALLS